MAQRSQTGYAYPQPLNHYLGQYFVTIYDISIGEAFIPSGTPGCVTYSRYNANLIVASFAAPHEDKEAAVQPQCLLFGM